MCVGGEKKDERSRDSWNTIFESSEVKNCLFSVIETVVCEELVFSASRQSRQRELVTFANGNHKMESPSLFVEKLCLSRSHLEVWSTWVPFCRIFPAFWSQAAFRGQTRAFWCVESNRKCVFSSPSLWRYEKTDASIWWQELAVAKEQSRFYACHPKTQSTNPFHPAQHPFFFKVTNKWIPALPLFTTETHLLFSR